MSGNRGVYNRRLIDEVALQVEKSLVHGTRDQLASLQKMLQEEHDKLEAHANTLAEEVAQKMTAIEAAQAEIDMFCKLRDVVAEACQKAELSSIPVE